MDLLFFQMYSFPYILANNNLQVRTTELSVTSFWINVYSSVKITNIVIFGFKNFDFFMYSFASWDWLAELR